MTSKIHLACDAVGRPLAFVVAGRNTNDCTRFTAVMDAIRVPRIGPVRPRTRPSHIIGDKDYSSKAIRAWLRLRGTAHTIAERADQIRNRPGGAAGAAGRPVSTGRSTKGRNVAHKQRSDGNGCWVAGPRQR
ncbi:transposase [Streptomyces sp. SLBN-118]|uniref:transposase n=1 Tax=Streptomyces sp. SLBN-118 TaxID=2768454 RepID=UPI00114EF229